MTFLIRTGPGEDQLPDGTVGKGRRRGAFTDDEGNRDADRPACVPFVEAPDPGGAPIKASTSRTDEKQCSTADMRIRGLLFESGESCGQLLEVGKGKREQRLDPK